VVKQNTSDGWGALRSQAPFAILTITAATTVVGLIGWLRWYTTGDLSGVTTFFRYLNPFFTLLFTGAEVGLSFYARSQFVKGDRLHSAWTLLTMAAVAHFIGRLLTTTLPQLDMSSNLHQIGVVIGGPLQMALLLSGLTQVARCFRQLALYRQLTSVDLVLLLMVGALTIRTVLGIHQFLAAGNPVSWSRVVLWTSDPLLLTLLIVTVFIRRSVINLGHGMLANCWQSYVVAIVLTSIGDASLWCTSCSTFPVWNSLGWYVWLVGDAAFALGPAFQVAAIERVQAGSRLLEEIAMVH
jgi:hypothetical protein